MALEAALSVREHERGAERLDLVATGPSSPFVSIRHTRAVLLELIDRAQRELILVSYAAYKVPALVEALEHAGLASAKRRFSIARVDLKIEYNRRRNSRLRFGHRNIENEDCHVD